MRNYILGGHIVDNHVVGYRNKHDKRIPQASGQHYEHDKQPHLIAKAARRQALKAMMDELKSQPCMDCLRSFPPVAMDYDHRDGRATKLWNPSQLPGIGSLRVMLEELAKCDLVCSNCHRVREQIRRAERTATSQSRVVVEEPPWTLF